MTVIDYSDTYDPDVDFDRHYTLATGRRIAERVNGSDRILELGCATGLMSSVLDGHLTTGRLTGVDHSAVFLERARARALPHSDFVAGELEDLPALEGRFEHVLATNVLHELLDPVGFLRTCRSHLAPGGLIHLTLQNPLSLHRLVAHEMGLIESLTEISERGAQWGTRGLWTADQLTELGLEAGLTVHARAGIMLKPLPNSAMAALPADVIEGFIKASHHLPEHCAMTYLVFAGA